MTEFDIFDSLALSPYDDSLPAKLLKEAFDFRIEQAQITTERIYHDVIKGSGAMFTVPEGGEEKLRLVVDASDQMIQEYKDGTIKLAKEKGHIVAQLKINGHSWLVQELNPVMIEPIELYFIQPLGGADLLPGNGKSIIFAKMV